ncbi:succinate dehydrogenase assembly factor 2 [Emcibacteraceae bacterium]|uniref:succinate dehydrogenase assembly factor 2 n=1 Tax=Pseudemcibacter sp. TaxID=2943293 RepID=UPI0023257D4C|nr:succinate dehydrogenase assembly factor 2 [Emcibacteraceae bacterium]MDA9553604.1 succinate dehydrogenase assembly factor 2 [Emcibacteraceae bacterium]MDA9770656.1 succinate dehydrogenase assembly factor 2 [Emcibacteraceae bacterium]MDG1021570.1 succinate dehydrogenase assembly factor 2 [Emcibacteraceae bacterium]MDG1728161.1 succinate dehydrogenase assembly factor 2 [Emcibacteraceae bacterium]
MTRFNTPGFIEGQIDKNESIDIRKKRLKFRSWHRGIKEADILLGSFADQFLHDMTDEQLDKYETLLREADSDLVAWITNDRPAPEHYDHDVMTMLKSIDYIKILK